TLLHAKVREAKKFNRYCLTFSSPFPVLFCKPPEFDPARLIWMKFQSELLQPLPKIPQEPVCLGLVLEAQDRIIRIADNHHLALRPLLAPDVHPEVETVVQINVREQRRNHRALRT